MELNDLLTKIIDGHETVFDVTGEGANKKLAVSLQRLQPAEPRVPLRAESPARKHEFLAAKSLADYLAEYGNSGTVVFADPINEVVSAVLDEKAEEGYQIVTMKPALHPLWAPWAGIAGKAITSDAFVAFVDANRRAIVVPNSRDLRMTLSQLRASVHTEIERGRGKSSVNGLMVRTKIQGVEKNETVELPESITIRVPLYVATDAKDIELDLNIEASSDGDITILVSAGTVAEARVAAFQEMIEAIRLGTAGIGATLTLGRPGHVDWRYLPEQKAV